MRLVSSRLRLVAIAFALVLLGAGCGGDDESTDVFQQDVVEACNTADEAFAYIRRPESSKDLIARLRTNRDRLATASGTIAAAEAPEDLAEERQRPGRRAQRHVEGDGGGRELDRARTERAGRGAGQVESLIFETWDAVNAALSDLREGGIAVPPLRPGGGARVFAAGSGAAVRRGAWLEHRHWLGEVARAQLAVAAVDQRRLLDAADLLRLPAARPEAAARRADWPGSARRR